MSVALVEGTVPFSNTHWIKMAFGRTEFGMELKETLGSLRLK